MVLFKSCPRCQTGDLVETADMYGRYRKCVQCSHTIELPRAQRVPWDVQDTLGSMDRRKAEQEVRA